MQEGKLIYGKILRTILSFAINQYEKKELFNIIKFEGRCFEVDILIRRLFVVIALISPFVVKTRTPPRIINLNHYKSQKNLLGYLANCENYVEFTHQVIIKHIISFFESISNYTIKTNPLLTKKYRKQVEELFMTTLYQLVGATHKKELIDEILKYRFAHSNSQTSDKFPDLVSIYNNGRLYNPITVYIENKQIDDKTAHYLSQIMSSQLAKIFVFRFEFIDCHITGNFDFEYGVDRFSFLNCQVDQNIKLPKYCAGGIIVSGCKITKKISFNDTSIRGVVGILNCHFSPTSALIMRNSTFIQKGDEFRIENTIFDGKIELSNIDSLYANTVFKNIKASSEFKFFNLYLNPCAELENIVVKNVPNIVKQLKKCLSETDYVIDRKKDLDLTSEKNNSKGVHWYPPKEAAAYIGKSVIFLAKMRGRDKIKVGKDSIPYLGEKKSIVYPKDALDAYICKDFKKLEELRQVYNFVKP